MNEHMPECPVEKRLRAGRTVGSQTCICAALRACEQRVFALHPEWTVTGLCKPDCAACRRLTELITEWEYGYEKGLDAAREAVSNITDRWDHWIGECVMTQAIDGQYINRDDALAAIDTLREEIDD